MEKQETMQITVAGEEVEVLSPRELVRRIAEIEAQGTGADEVGEKLWDAAYTEDLKNAKDGVVLLDVRNGELVYESVPERMPVEDYLRVELFRTGSTEIDAYEPPLHDLLAYFSLHVATPEDVAEECGVRLNDLTIDDVSEHYDHEYYDALRQTWADDEFGYLLIELSLDSLLPAISRTYGEAAKKDAETYLYDEEE